MKRIYFIGKMKRITGLAILSLSLFLLNSCNSTQGEQNAPEEELAQDMLRVTKEQFQDSQMRMGTLKQHEFHQKVKANGMIDVPPDNKASVSAYFGGYVKKLNLLPGQKVTKGQVLFVLENPSYVELQQNYLESKGRLKYLKSDYERQQKLAEENVTSEKNFLRAESDYKVEWSKFEGLKEKLKMMHLDPNSIMESNLRSTIVVTSPISGYITTVNATRGMYLDPSDVALSITNTDHLHLEINIFEKDMPKVKKGQNIRFRLQDDPAKSYDATVHLVGKSIEPEKRIINVHGHLKNEEDEELFSPGMYIEAEIMTASDSSAALPEEAVVDIEGRSYVLIEKEQNEDSFIFQKKEVKTGNIEDGAIAIANASDFPKGTSFLTKGAFNLIKE